MIHREVTIPSVLTSLQKPWFGTKHDPLVETLVRAGAGIVERDGRFHIMRGAHAKTTVSDSIPIETVARFIALRRKEYLQPSQSGAASHAYERLDNHLRQRSIRLAFGHEFRGDGGIDAIGKDALSITNTIIRIVPEKHLRSLRAIELGGTKHGSVYYEHAHGKLHMLTPALTGPKRNYMALLLLGMGETFYLQLPGQDMEALNRIHKITSETRYGVDYLHGERSRIEDQKDIGVFVTENYMHYVTQGDKLDRFIACLGGAERIAWEELMRIYQRNFDGIRYVNGPDE